MIINNIKSKLYTISIFTLLTGFFFLPGISRSQIPKIYDVRIAEPEDTVVTLVYKDTLILPSFKEFDLNVKLRPACSISAISIGIYFPEEYLEITDILLKDKEHGYTWNISDSLLRLVWSDISPIIFDEDDTILVLKMRTLDISGLTETIRLRLKENTEFADPSANVIEDVILEVPEIQYLRPDTIDTVTGYYVRIYPNPFRNSTTLYFGLEEESQVRVSLVNPDGMLILDKGEKYYAEGDHQLRIDSLDLAVGVFFLKFEIRNSKGKKEELFKIMSTR
jgi:hypothetical protein